MALLGAVAAAQILAATLSLHSWLARVTNAVANQSGGRAPFPAREIAGTPAAMTRVPAATVPREEAPPKSDADTLLHAAKGFRERGDTTNAIAKLQQATALDPTNPEILAELAMTYESMQLFDRSNEVWRRLQSLGAGAGPLYELADLKLRVGVPARSNLNAAGNPVPDNGAPASDAAGIPDGSTFGISEVTLRQETDPDAETKLLLRVGVKVRPDTPIDHTKVKIQVFFYDMVNNDQVVLTNADVSYEWVTPGHDWADTGTEVLDVTYLRPKRNDPVPGTAMRASPWKCRIRSRKRTRRAQIGRRRRASADERERPAPISRLYRPGLLQGPTPGGPGRSDAVAQSFPAAFYRSAAVIRLAVLGPQAARCVSENRPARQGKIW